MARADEAARSEKYRRPELGKIRAFGWVYIGSRSQAEKRLSFKRDSAWHSHVRKNMQGSFVVPGADSG
jgi:hypothetical protein